MTEIAIEKEYDPQEVSIEFLEEHYREVLIEKATISRMMETTGWKLYAEFLQRNAKTLADATHGAVFQNFGDVFSDQFAKGKAEGLRQGPEIITGILNLYDAALSEIQRLIKERTNGSGTEHPSGNAERDTGSDERDAEPELPFADQHAP